MTGSVLHYQPGFLLANPNKESRIIAGSGCHDPNELADGNLVRPFQTNPPVGACPSNADVLAFDLLVGAPAGHICRVSNPIS